MTSHKKEVIGLFVTTQAHLGHGNLTDRGGGRESEKNKVA